MKKDDINRIEVPQNEPQRAEVKNDMPKQIDVGLPYAEDLDPANLMQAGHASCEKGYLPTGASKGSDGVKPGCSIQGALDLAVVDPYEVRGGG